MVEGAQVGAAEFAAELERVERRLRGLSEARLRQPLPPYGTVADAGRRLAQLLADGALGVEQRSAAAVRPRELPTLRDTSVADQVAVTGHDLLAAIGAVADGEQVWQGTSRVQARDLVLTLHRAVREIKLAID